MSTPSAALLASLARATKKAAARPRRATVARARMAEVDGILCPALRHYWQGSASYSMDQMVAEGREIVLDGTEAPTLGRR